MSPAGEPLLALAGIGHSFGRTRALDAVDFTVRAGEVHGLIGHNGAGKSTLIKVMAGVLHPDSGTVTVAGRRIATGVPAASHAAGLRFIHQNAPLVPIFDAVENCFLGRRYPRRRGMIDRQAMRAEVAAIAARLAPELPLDVPAARLSAGMRQLVLIVRAMADRGRVLVLDEPTAALSAAETDRLLRALCDLRAEGIGMVFVSHRLDEVLAVCDRVTSLHDGRRGGSCATGEATVADLVRLMGFEAPADRQRHGAGGDRTPVLRLAGMRLVPGGPSFDLDVGGGEVVALYGRNGAGRSRLLRAIWGEGAVSGAMQLDGSDFRPRGPRQAIARGVAYVPDDRRRNGLLADRPLVENLTLPRLARFRAHAGLPVPDRRREAAAFADAASRLRLVFGSPRQPAATLSGGNQQKLMFGRWLQERPRLLLLDEPSEGVDIAAKAEIHRLVRDMAAQGCAVLLATSDRDEALALGDRIAVMRGGALAAVVDGSAADGHALDVAAQAAEAA
ncbi:MAG: sugar ABC transporter ATP-binding protein [Alphaproteobacteria bacterium]